tara:strand:+ start:54 stop:290 length:237 start_codon:yes stop_codon:yes gene_type:complete
VRFFALYRDRTGTSRQRLELPENSTVSDLLKVIRSRYPQLAPTNVDIVVAVNAEYADENIILSEEDEVALIPPVSGGE